MLGVLPAEEQVWSRDGVWTVEEACARLRHLDLIPETHSTISLSSK